MDVIEVDDPEESGLGALVSEHPLAALGGALALGYLLGGGLATPVSRRLLRRGVQAGFQLAFLPQALPQYEDEISELASRLGRTLRRAADGHGGAPPPDHDSDDSMRENEGRDL
jgi:hypothetical protein